MTDRIHSRHGFSAIELMVVIGIMGMLAGMSVPSLVSAMRRGKVNEAANAIVQVSSQARRLAKRNSDPSQYYGVVIVNDASPRYVALTYGTSASTATILEEDGEPVAKLAFNRNVIAYDGETPLSAGSAASAWMYQNRTANPIQAASATAPAVSILGLNLRTLDGRLRTAVALYSIGLIHVRDR